MVRPPIKIDDNRWLLALDRDMHTWLHSSKGFNWNGKWDEFITSYSQGASAEKVMAFLEKL